MSQTDESLFEVGRNVATSEGSVVFENELFQLLEYKPLTAKVHERPLPSPLLLLLLTIGSSTFSSAVIDEMRLNV